MNISVVKIMSTLLMSSLMTTSLSAATASFDERTTIKIQKLYRDRKLNKTFEALEQRSKDIKRGVVPGPTEEDLEKNIASLNEHSDLKSMGLPAVFFINAKDLDIRPFVGRYQGYIQSQMTSRDPVRRQVASLIMAELAGKAAAESNKLKTVQHFLQETVNSDYPFFKHNSYMQLSELAKDSGDIDQAFRYLRKGLILPSRYHASICRKLAYLVESEEYKPTQERYLKQIIEIGTPKEKIKALLNLACLYSRNESNSTFYRPSEALAICNSLLTNSHLVSFLDKDNVHLQMATVLAWSSDEEIKNVDRAVDILEGIFLKRPNDWNYSNATNQLISILITKDPARAISLALEALINPNLQQPFKSYIEKSLAHLYGHGPENTRNYQEALRILEEQAAAPYGKDFDPNYRSYVLLSLAQLLQYEDVTVKNVARAIQINEDLCKDSKMKLSALISLAYIYQYDAEHKDPVKLAECLNELVELYADKPLEQLKTLTQLLKIYATEGAAFNIEEAKAAVQRILTHSAVDSTARLDVQITLSKLFHTHPESGSAEEVIQINEALAHNPMTTPLDVENAHHRLIAAYLAQQNFEQVVIIYEHFLTRAADWQRNSVIRDFISFLENPDHAAVQNAARVAELRALLPQAAIFMTEERVQLPGIVAGFGGTGHVDPYFSPEMIANRKASLLALSGDHFDQANYQTNLERTVAEVKEAIAQYGARDADFAATAVAATEVFETGNTHPSSYRPTIQDLDYTFSIDDLGREMAYGEALVRIWARITHHPDANHLKDLIVLQLAAAIDPDGHIVCPIGKIMRHFQAMEGTFPDIHAVTLSLENAFSGFAKNEQNLIDALPAEHPLKILESKIGEIREAAEYKVDADNWVSPEYQGKFDSLSSDDQTLLNNQYEQMVLKFEQDLLKSRDALSEAEKLFARKEVGKYLSVAWFVG